MYAAPTWEDRSGKHSRTRAGGISQPALEAHGQTRGREKVMSLVIWSVLMCFLSSINLCTCPQTLDQVISFLLILIGRILQEKLDQPVSAPPSPREVSMEIDSPENMMRHIRFLKSEVERLKRSLRTTELQRESLSHHARMHSCTNIASLQSYYSQRQINSSANWNTALIVILTVAHGIHTIYSSRLQLVLPN